MGAVTIDVTAFRYSEAERPALRDAHLTIEPGQFVLVTGPSGSGKTTLANLCNGLIPHVRGGLLEGGVVVDGRDTRQTSIGDLGLRVGTVFQDPRTQFFTLNTAEEVAFGCRNHGLDRPRIVERVTQAFVELGIPALADRGVLGLSSGEKQKVALAACYALGPDVFLLDEPSANLDPASTAHLTRILAGLKRRGATVIVLEHRVHYLTGLADRVVYLAEGRIRRDCAAAEFLALSAPELTALGLRRLDLADPPARPGPPPSSPSAGPAPGGGLRPDPAGVSFACEDIVFRHPRRRGDRPAGEAGGAAGLSGVTLSARAGEVIGVVGPNGAGKTTLARVCAGLERERAGRILLGGAPASARDRLGRVHLVVQDSGYQLFSDSVLGELHPGRRGAGAQETDRRILASLGLWELRDAHPAALSRGQQQRLTIAAALAADADVLFLDEPSSGLDHRAMTAVARAITGLARGGRIVFVISHDHELLAACCTRLIAIEQGRVALDAPADGVSLAAVLPRFDDGAPPVGGRGAGGSGPGSPRAPGDAPVPAVSQRVARALTSTVRIDPRIRLLIATAVTVGSFLVSAPVPAGAVVALAAALLVVVGRWRAALATTAVAAAAAAGAAAVPRMESSMLMLTLAMIVYLVQKLVVMTMMGLFLAADMSVSLAVSALERLRAPAAVSVPFSVALRFAPTIGQDWRALTDSLRVRGLAPGPCALAAHPLRTLEQLVVPILMRALRSSDELACAGLVRGLDAPGPRTVLHDLRIGAADLALAGLVIGVTAAVVVVQRL